MSKFRDGLDYIRGFKIEENPHSKVEDDKWLIVATLQQVVEKCKNMDVRYDLLIYKDVINRTVGDVYVYNDTSLHLINSPKDKVPLFRPIGLIEFFSLEDKFVLTNLQTSASSYAYSKYIKELQGENNE